MSPYDLVLAALSDGAFASQNRVISALRSGGAVSPATARSLADLNLIADETWQRLVVAGRVREGPPGRFYLFDPPRPSRRQRVIDLVFYALIVLIPIVLILASTNGH